MIEKVDFSLCDKCSGYRFKKGKSFCEIKQHEIIHISGFGCEDQEPLEDEE